MKSVALRLLASNRFRFWPQWIAYFAGCAVFKLSGRRLFGDRTLQYRELRLTADVSGNNGLAFLSEIAVEDGYSLCNEVPNQQPGILFDVGANCGFFTLTRCVSNPQLKAYCFEPHPRTYQRLQKNVQANNYQSRIWPIHAAVGAETGECKLAVSPESSMGVVATSTFPLHKADGFVTVPLVTLDEFAASAGVRPDFIKIDVEGFEAEILKGAANCLKTVTWVVIECHSNELIAQCANSARAAGLKPIIQGGMMCARRH